ncbi:type III PLP-dependent enzyme domain-containing protein [Methylococcus geothermalis]|uniref:Carboxynorspermidine/carboxyspermidine decarboxylase n=1 Tax=Methylococcus geothermalis TaxID=2681310 RepID=A0A858Q3X5_9GAMM|nr:carboxynorspermidine decarboxylase [Methylococcus geothermalis]QJD28524.1 carboxynorspermidine decarboxylase [Methylococcus geothermalis]
MLTETLKRLLPETPAFVYDQTAIDRTLLRFRQAAGETGPKLLYSVKSFPFLPLLRRIAPRVDGFSASSLFEAKLCAEALAGRGSLHITTPGFRPGETDEIGRLCDFVSFNSLNQFDRWSARMQGTASTGLRVNPQRSFLPDPRYDPCRPHSKLGVPLDRLALALAGAGLEERLQGIHFHTVFDSAGFEPLTETLAELEKHLGEHLKRLQWINLGGGYRLDRSMNLERLAGLSAWLQRDYGLEVYFEPGKAVAGPAGYLVASVLDVFDSAGKTVAVLDTSVNHHPEVFEYQRSPRLAEACEEGGENAILAGGTCLAGDLFGEYPLPARPHVGDRFVFKNVGAYTLVKANRFNGHNLPSIYRWDGEALHLEQSHGYEDYRRQWAGEPAAQ